MGLHPDARGTLRRIWPTTAFPATARVVAWDCMTFLYEFRGTRGKELVDHFVQPILQSLLRETEQYALVFDSPGTPPEKDATQQKRRRALAPLSGDTISEDAVPAPWVDALGTPRVRERILSWLTLHLRAGSERWLPEKREFVIVACCEVWRCRHGSAPDRIGEVPACAREGDCGCFWWLESVARSGCVARSLDSDCLAVGLVREADRGTGLVLRLANRGDARFAPQDPVDAREPADCFDLAAIVAALRAADVSVWNAVFVIAAQGTDFSPRLMRGLGCARALVAALGGSEPLLAREPCLLQEGSFDVSRARALLARLGPRANVHAEDADFLRAAWVVEYWAGRVETFRRALV